jgi:hypothetical protein
MILPKKSQQLQVLDLLRRLSGCEKNHAFFVGGKPKRDMASKLIRSRTWPAKTSSTTWRGSAAPHDLSRQRAIDPAKKTGLKVQTGVPPEMAGFRESVWFSRDSRILANVMLELD